jgi:hypothetical protein
LAENIPLVAEEREIRHLPQNNYPTPIREEKGENSPVSLGQRKGLICQKLEAGYNDPCQGWMSKNVSGEMSLHSPGEPCRMLG